MVTSKYRSHVYTPDRRQSKTLLTIDERDRKSLEAMFSIDICRQLGDKWQSETLFLTIIDLRSSIVLTFSIAACPVWFSFMYNLVPDILACDILTFDLSLFLVQT